MPCSTPVRCRPPPTKIHQILQNPIYCGGSRWLGTLYQGQHEPLITRTLFKAVQDVFEAANRPPYAKHRYAFTGLLNCALCGCSYTAEIKKGRYVYYHCTGHRGQCGNAYIREEELAQLFGDVVKRVRIPAELADQLASTLRESQTDRATFVRTQTMRLQQEQLLLWSKLDAVYDDRLSKRISEDRWTRKSAELEGELERVRSEMARHDQASHDYEQTGLQILELAQTTYSLYVTDSSRTGETCENAAIELLVRSRNSNPYIQ